jgi:hypothetical protein
VSVAAKAAAVHLDATRAATVTAANRTVTFIPLVNADLPPSAKTLEGGAVVGALTVTGTGGTLAPGQYNVFLSKTADGWQAVLERDGKIATSSRTVAVAAETTDRAIPRPLLQATGESEENIERDDASVSQTEGDGSGSLLSLASYRPASPLAHDSTRAGKVTITVGGKDWKVTITFSW